jgi:hypothetical protein
MKILMFLVPCLLLIVAIVFISLHANNEKQKDRFNADTLAPLSKFDICIHEFSPIFHKFRGRYYKHHHTCRKCGYVTKPISRHPVFI